MTRLSQVPLQTPPHPLETSHPSLLSPSASGSSSSRSGSELASPASYLTASTLSSPMSSPSFSPLSSASSPVFTFQSPPLAPHPPVYAKTRTASFCSHAALRQLSSTCKRRPPRSPFGPQHVVGRDLNNTLCVRVCVLTEVQSTNMI